MNVQGSISKIHHLRFQVGIITSLLITVFVWIFWFYRSVSLIDSFLGWLISNLIAWGVIGITFRYIKNLQIELNKKIKQIEKRAQHDAALAQLSGGFAATLDENTVCDELASRLHTVQGYDYVAVFTIDPTTGNRVLRTEVVRNNVIPTPVLRPGEGLSERAILDRKPYYTPDITKEPAHMPGLTQGSEIDVPIEFNGEMLGVLIIESQDTHAFDSSDLELLVVVADQAALALKNVRLLSEETKRRRQAEILQRATSTLTTDLELDQVLEQILEQLKQVIEHDSACIFILEGDSVHAVAARDIPNMSAVVGKRFPAKNQLFHLVLEQKRPVILDDVQGDSRYEGWGDTYQVCSWMGVPLIANDKVIGYLTLDSLYPKAYSPEQANLALIIANQAAVAIENAQLYRNARDSADRQKILHQVSQEIIRAGLDLDRLYESIHTATAQLMPTDSFVISILDDQANEIEAVYLFDRGEREPSRRFSVGQGLSGYVIDTGKPVLTFDYSEQAELGNVNVLHFGSDDRVRSLLAVPMKLGDKVIGMLSAQTYQAYDYSNEDQQLLDMLAAYAAIAIDNTRLFGEIQRLAITDSLTGTYNRRHFFNMAQQEIIRARRYGHPISIMMLDLDYYKEINDTHGHDIGDLALKLIAQNCHQHIRQTDLLARYGGDEFIVLLPETNIEQGEEIAERLRSHLALTPIQVRGKTIKTTISVGVSGASESIPELNALLKCADLALYAAKEAGRNAVKIQACTSSND